MKKGSVSLIAFIASLLLAGCGGGSIGGGVQPPPPPVLGSISTTPTNQSLAVGAQQQFSAACKTTDNSSMNCPGGMVWSSSNKGVATINAATGMAQAVAAGTTTINASVGSVVSNPSATLTVTAVQPPPPIIVSLPQNLTMASGNNLAIHATVQNDSTNKGVTWTTNGGMFVSNGASDATFTDTVSVDTVVTITATSVADPSKSGSTQVTVTAAVNNNLTLTSVSPQWFFCHPAYTCKFAPVLTWTGTGFGGGELVSIDGFADTPLPSGVSATTFSLLLDVGDAPQNMVEYKRTVVKEADGSHPSNTITLASLGDASIADNSSTEVFAIDPSNHTVNRFDLPSGTLSKTAAVSNTATGNIAVTSDATGATKFVVIDQGGPSGIVYYDRNLSQLDQNHNVTSGGATDGQLIQGISAKADLACAAEPSTHQSWCVPMAFGVSAPIKFSPAGIQPVATAISTGCAAGIPRLFVYDAEGQKLYAKALASDGSATDVASVPLPQFTQPSKFPAGVLPSAMPNWYVAALDSSCKVAVMGPTFNANGVVGVSVTVIDGGTMQEAVVGGKALPTSTTLVAARLKPSNNDSSFRVFSADVSTSGVTKISKVDLSGNVTSLSSTSPMFSAGSGTFQNGGNSFIYLIGWDKTNNAAGLQFFSVLNQ